jgi:hypothetical protein
VKIRVGRPGEDGELRDDFEAGLISATIEAGNLSLTFYTEELEEEGFKIFADRQWSFVECYELPNQAVRDRVKARRLERETQDDESDRHSWGQDHGYGQHL